MLRKAALILAVAASLLFVQCGNSSTRTATTNTPAPNPGATNPTPSPNTSPDSYLATVVCCVVSRTPVAVGQTTVDASSNNGAGVWPTVGNASGANQVLKFCPFPQPVGSCMTIASYTATAGGTPPVNFTFPSKGTFAGNFVAFLNGDNTEAMAYTASGASGALNFRAAMLPAGTITGGIGQATGSASGSGMITATGTTAHLALSGTTASHTFQVSVCGIDAAHCRALSNITTDSQGNANSDVGTLNNQDNDVFLVSDSSGVEFISAFRVQ